MQKTATIFKKIEEIDFGTEKVPHIFFSAKNMSTVEFMRTLRLNDSLTNDFVQQLMSLLTFR